MQLHKNECGNTKLLPENFFDVNTTFCYNWFFETIYRFTLKRPRSIKSIHHFPATRSGIVLTKWRCNEKSCRTTFEQAREAKTLETTV